MSQLRLNPLTGRWVTIAVERAARPGELISPEPAPVDGGPRSCPFCPGNEEATPPALETYGPGGQWVVRVVPNLYPAFEGDEPMRETRLGPVFTQATASGVHEVLVFSPDHRGSWADLGDKEAGLTMAAIRDRMEAHASSGTIQYTQAIVNAGRAAGASLEHPHGQLLGIPFVPDHIAEEQAGFARFEGGCLLCTVRDEESASGHRTVIETDRVLVVCPFWSGAPFEMLVLPKAHAEHLEGAAPADVVAVGRAIRDALVKLRSRLGEVAHNIVFHTAPHQHGGPYHWHAHVVPRLTSLAGFEQGTGVMINIVAPETAARDLTTA